MDSAFKGLLEYNRLSENDLFRHTGGECVSKPGKRVVRTLVLEDESKRKFLYYIKIAQFEGCKKLWRRFFKGEGLHTSLYKEYRLVQRYQKANIPVMNPVAFCEKRVIGIPTKAFLIIEEVKGESFINRYKGSSVKERQKLVYSLGQLISESHNNGIESIVRPNDIICTSADYNSFKDCLTLIDREHGDYKKRYITIEACSQQLAKMLIKAIPFIGMPSKRELISFLRAYIINSNFKLDLRTFYHDVLKKLNHKITSKPKYDKITHYFKSESG